MSVPVKKIMSVAELYCEIKKFKMISARYHVQGFSYTIKTSTKHVQLCDESTIQIDSHKKALSNAIMRLHLAWGKDGFDVTIEDDTGYRKELAMKIGEHYDCKIVLTDF